ncbi:MAG: secondary thiamine-phosphate synthase enzyme YjbQ [Chloroflexota bacterium]
MTVISMSIELETKGNADMLNITQAVSEAVSQSEVISGVATVFCPSATSGLTTLEYESGCIADLRRLFDAIIDPNQEYAHNARWGDGNGHSHVRAALIGPSLAVPFVDRILTLGTWQQIIYLDFDNRARSRKLVVQIIGE